jgi:ketosteroid isomerase-like protein
MFLVSTVTGSQGGGQDEASFQAFLRQFEDGVRRFINGDPTSWKQHASHRSDVTIMGAWGAYEKGWTEAGARYDWAAARFKESGATPAFEYISSGVSGDLAYTVAIERSKVRVTGQDTPAAMPLRVTHIFRRENGQWRLIHRHADPLMDKTAPATVLKK